MSEKDKRCSAYLRTWAKRKRCRYKAVKNGRCRRHQDKTVVASPQPAIEGDVAGENSPERLIQCLRPHDHYAIVAIEGDRNNTTLILQRGDFVKCFKAIAARLFDELYDECGYSPQRSLKVCDEIYSDCRADWLSENSPEEENEEEN